VVSLAWNPRVPRVCCSLDATGLAIVWDLKKKGAVKNFKADGGVDVVFSQDVATVLYVLTQKAEIDVWDLRQQQARSGCIKVSPDATKLRYNEGLDNSMGVYYKGDIVESYDTKTGRLQGRQQLGEQFSFFYPNCWVSLGETEPILSTNTMIID